MDNDVKYTRSKYAIHAKYNGLEVTIGNRKLGQDTMIINMGSATDCPSRALGYCRVRDCYALKAERLHPQVLPYRRRQEAYWRNTKATQILHDIRVILRRFPKIRFIRFNESGDFWSQDDITKLDFLAVMLDKVEIYGYSARKDLNFQGAQFRCKSSGHDNGNNGQTIVIPKTATAPAGYKLCPTDCRVCNLCKSGRGYNIAFHKH